VFIDEILANMTQVSDVAPGPLVFCIIYRGCKLANEMTQDLCTSDDKGNFTVFIKVRGLTNKWESVCAFYRFPDDSMKWRLWGSHFISIESTCIDNKLGFSLNIFIFDFIC
jgi:hypothetical protein